MGLMKGLMGVLAGFRGIWLGLGGCSLVSWIYFSCSLSLI